MRETCSFALTLKPHLILCYTSLYVRDSGSKLICTCLWKFKAKTMIDETATTACWRNKAVPMRPDAGPSFVSTYRNALSRGASNSRYSKSQVVTLTFSGSGTLGTTVIRYKNDIWKVRWSEHFCSWSRLLQGRQTQGKYLQCHAEVCAWVGCGIPGVWDQNTQRYRLCCLRQGSAIGVGRIFFA